VDFEDFPVVRVSGDDVLSDILHKGVQGLRQRAVSYEKRTARTRCLLALLRQGVFLSRIPCSNRLCLGQSIFPKRGLGITME